MLKFFELENHEVMVFRIWTILAGVFIPVFGLFLLYFVEGAIDNMVHRCLLSFYWLFFLGASFLNDTIKKYLSIPCFIGNFITIAWIIWIVNQNSFSTNYSTGLFLCLSGIAIINRSNIEMVIFYIFSFILLFYSFYFYPEVEISKAIFLLSVFILFIIHIVVMGKRDYINYSLKTLNQKLRLKNNRLKQLIFVSSHDLKTPLWNISSFSSLLESDLTEGKLELSEKEYYLKLIIGSIKNIDRKLDDLRDYFKHDNTEIEFDYFDLEKKLISIQNKIRNENPNTHIEFDIDKGMPPKIVGNEYQLGQLFYRLIDNGIKYNESETKKIKLSYLLDSKYHVFSIRDNGIGIEMKYKDRIFDLFQRLHMENEFSGTGVGLAICKVIVENHKGDIWLESGKLDEWSEFCFKIPKRILLKK